MLPREFQPLVEHKFRISMDGISPNDSILVQECGVLDLRLFKSEWSLPRTGGKFMGQKNGVVIRAETSQVIHNWIQGSIHPTRIEKSTVQPCFNKGSTFSLVGPSELGTFETSIMKARINDHVVEVSHGWGYRGPIAKFFNRRGNCIKVANDTPRRLRLRLREVSKGVPKGFPSSAAIRSTKNSNKAGLLGRVMEIVKCW